MDSGSPDASREATWRAWLLDGRPPLRLPQVFMRRVLRRLPGSPRCKLCNRPFGGIGRAVDLFGLGASRKNPNMCLSCIEGLPSGGAEVDVAVLFADVRGSTGLGERMEPRALAELMNRFYRAATEVLLEHGALIDKFIGDEVMALFIPGLSGARYRQLAARSSEGLLRAVGYGVAGEEPWLALGIGVHAGPAFVGNVGTQGVNDFTAIGDTVNTAARLCSEAAAGEVILSEIVYGSVADRYPGLPDRVLSLRGRDEPLLVRVLRVEGS